MNPEIEIISTDNLAVRAYIKFYFNGIRYREYNGKRIGKEIHPNREKSLEARDKALRTLRLEIQTALENSYFFTPRIVETVKEKKPFKQVVPKSNSPGISAREHLSIALQKKLASNLTAKYKKSLNTTHDQFVKFLTSEELIGSITDLKPTRIDEFLSSYSHSNTYYMSKRTELSVLFAIISRQANTQLNIIKQTDRKRIKAKLHTIYEKARLIEILDYLKVEHYNLYLCCLLTYGAFLRPHKEVRLLTKGHFKKDATEIHLSGDENKGGKVRIVPVSPFLRKELLPLLAKIDEDINIFSGSTHPHNGYYFGTAWSRTWMKSTDVKIKKNETIYSFRHTAAVDVYRRTKDIHVLQQLMGHSDMIVTLNYLRGLGEINLEKLKEVMPEL